MFLQLSGLVAADPVRLSDPLDTSSTDPAPEKWMPDTSCFAGRFSDVAITE